MELETTHATVPATGWEWHLRGKEKGEPNVTRYLVVAFTPPKGAWVVPESQSADDEILHTSDLIDQRGVHTARFLHRNRL